MTAWDTKDVSTWIARCLKLPYGKLFEEAHVDGARLVQLKAEDLRKIGISDPRHIETLESYIEIFRSLLGSKESLAMPVGKEADAKRGASPRGVGKTLVPRVSQVRPPTVRNGIGSVRSSSPAASSPEQLALRDRRASLGSLPVFRSGANSTRASVDGQQTSSTSSVAKAARSTGTFDVRPSRQEPQNGDITPKDESFTLWAEGKPAAPALHSAVSFESISLTQQSGRISRSPSGPSRREGSIRQQQVNDSTFQLKQGSFSRAVTGRLAPREASPGHYCGQVPATAPAPATFGRAPRYTDQGLLSKGQEGPGVGRYSPPPRIPARGGMFDREKRWKDATEKSPGPLTYRPQATALSTFGRGTNNKT